MVSAIAGQVLPPVRVVLVAAAAGSGIGVREPCAGSMLRTRRHLPIQGPFEARELAPGTKRSPTIVLVWGGTKGTSNPSAPLERPQLQGVAGAERHRQEPVA